MGDSTFRLKQFNIAQQQDVFKIGTDSMLLGAWANHCSPSTALDIGTGTGIIALMLAQRFPTTSITAIDIHKPSVILAQENFATSPWADRLSAVHQDIAEGFNGSFDLITCNPPYFQNSYKSDDTNRNRTRQNLSLSLPDLFIRASQLLRESGKFCLILPVDSKLPENTHLHLTRKRMIKGHDDAPIKRMLLEYSKIPAVTVVEPNLVIESSRHIPTHEYRELTGAFYLHF